MRFVLFATGLVVAAHLSPALAASHTPLSGLGGRCPAGMTGMPPHCQPHQTCPKGQAKNSAGTCQPIH